MSQKDGIVSKEPARERKAARQQSGETSRGNDATQLISSSLEEKYIKSLEEAMCSMEVVEAENSTKPKIQKIPFMLRDNDNFNNLKYLEPRVVSIGPFHAKNSILQVTHEIKLKLAGLFIQDSGVDINELYKGIMFEIADFRGCYTDEATEGYNNEELAWMFLVDGCALLQFMIICASDEEDRDEKLKQVKIKEDHIAFVQQDVFLLDNQLPYELLELLMGLSQKKDELKDSMENFILDSLSAPLDLANENQKNYQKAWEDEKPHHLLDLLRTTLIQPDDGKDASHENNPMGEGSQQTTLIQPDDGKDASHENNPMGEGSQQTTLIQPDDGKDASHETNPMREESQKRKKLTDALTFKKKHVWDSSFRNIEELKAAWIRLKPGKTSSMRGISFSSGTLRIPPIIVDDWTEAKLLNLAAYEMCPDFQNEFEVSTYIFFMDSLIDRAQDVKELRESGILLNALGSDEEVAKLFNRISTDLVPNQMYEDVRKEIQSYCDNKWMTWIAQFLARYFHSPWSVIAFIAAIFVLVLTIVQTVYTVIGYYNKA